MVKEMPMEEKHNRLAETPLLKRKARRRHDRVKSVKSVKSVKKVQTIVAKLTPQLIARLAENRNMHIAGDGKGNTGAVAELGAKLSDQGNLKIDRHLTRTYSPAHEIADELKAAISGEVRFDDGTRALYATDGSNYRQVPIGVVIPRTADDIIKTVEICRKYGVPITSRGGGTSLAGQCCNVAVIIDMSKYYNQILEINYQEKYARVQPGVVLDVLRDKAEEKHLTFGPDPSTHNHCTLGGMIGNNSCGVHALMAGTTAENVIELDVLLYDGTRMRVGATSDEELQKIYAEGGRKAEVYRQIIELRDRYEPLIRSKFPNIPRRVSGYNFPDLLPENGLNIARSLVGSEGTLVIVLEAKLRLVDSPPYRTLVVLGYKDIFSAADHVPEILQFKPIGLEAMDELLSDYMQKKGLHSDDLNLLPEGGGWLICEFGGASQVEADEKGRDLMRALEDRDDKPTMKLYDDKHEETLVWTLRKSGLGATARVPGEPDTWPGWEDSAVHPEQLAEYLREIKALFEKHKYKASLYGHFGQGCLHCRIPFDLKTVDGVQSWRRFMIEAAHLVVKHNGSLSGEHGDGQARAEFLPIMFGDEIIRGFDEFKTIWDPDWKMNPGKVVRPNKFDQNLRVGPTHSPPSLDTLFSFPEDDFSFARATTRCVGVGECRRHEGGVMCPSYMVTMEEKHSTRGRAHLLFEMLVGDPSKGGWRNEDVKDALDLCLACKGCKSDCPVNVDMATYKAEFLSHYYKGRLRPRHAYAFALIGIWCRLAEYVPNLVNLLAHAPILANLTKFAAGVDQSREVPRFSPEPFRTWFEKRPVVNPTSPLVLLFPDTFNNYFHAYTARAAVEVLESAGFQVRIPADKMCCGRPLYDYGMVPMARKWLDNIMAKLADYIEAGVPIVVLEPSCAAVFRDELGALFPGYKDAQRLAGNVYVLGEFLMKFAPQFEYPKLQGRAVLQTHCHHKAILTKDVDEKILNKMGLEVDVPEPGCCGMAGAFGFEKEHCQVSHMIGQQRLYPALAEGSEDELVVADGFSCREQIRQGSNKFPLHLGEVLYIAAKNGRIQRTLVDMARQEKAEKLKLTRTETALCLTICGAMLAGFFKYLIRRQLRKNGLRVK